MQSFFSRFPCYINFIADDFRERQQTYSAHYRGNKRPAFVLNENSLIVRPIKPMSPHISIKSDKLELMYFSGSRFSQLLESAAAKKIIFEYNVSSFKGKEYIKGFIRDIIYSSESGKYITEDSACGYYTNKSRIPVFVIKHDYIAEITLFFKHLFCA